MNALEDLLKRANENASDQQGQAQFLLTAPEAERMVEGIARFEPDGVGTVKWLTQHDWIEKLNLQAHQNARLHQDEFVMEFLASYDKINVLIHELLSTEVWREMLFPRQREHLAKEVDNITTYQLLYHEGAVANLLEICLFHPSALEAIDEDHMIELVDWCQWKFLYLNTRAHKDKEFEKPDAKRLLSMTELDELDEKDRETRFGAAMCALSIFRYVTDNAARLSLGTVSRIQSTHDMPLALLAMLDNPPWERRRDGVLERLVENKWTEVAGAERVRLCQNAAQVWLALNNLVVDDRFRQRYQWDGFRKESLQKAKRHMNEVLFDQLPPLKDLQRVVEEINLGAQAAAGAEPAGRGLLILEQVPHIREGMLACKDWDAAAQSMVNRVFRAGKKERDQYTRQRVDDMVKAFEMMMEMEGTGEGVAPGRGEEDVVYFESKRKAAGGGWVVHDHFSCPVDRGRDPEAVELTGEDGTVVRGTRMRLAPPASSGVVPMPSAGKVVVRHRGMQCEALIDLPAPHTKDAIATVPGVVWLTIGILATDGFALQLKLKRDAGAAVRDKEAGVYCAYVPVGGAVTVRDTS